MAIIRRRDAPNSSFSIAKLQLLIGGVLMKAVRGIRYNGMNAVILLLLKPVEAVGVQ
jgi:hypothetical protein